MGSSPYLGGAGYPARYRVRAGDFVPAFLKHAVEERIEGQWQFRFLDDGAGVPGPWVTLAPPVGFDEFVSSRSYVSPAKSGYRPIRLTAEKAEKLKALGQNEKLIVELWDQS